MKKYQIVSWFPYWHGFHFVKFEEGAWKLIYEWCLFLGFWEIRKWSQTDWGREEEV